MHKPSRFNFTLKQFADLFDYITFAQTYCWNVDMCKSSQTIESWNHGSKKIG